MKKGKKLEAIILAARVALAGFFTGNGLTDFAARNRVITVKGLTEMEARANKVT